MPSICCISDTHRQYVPNLPQADILLHCGDYSSVGSFQDLQLFCDHLEAYKSQFSRIVCISGNHDRLSEKDPQLTREMIESTGAIYLQDSGCELLGLKFWGTPVSPAFGYNWAWNRQRGEDIQKHYDLIPEDTNVLLCHSPVQGILDKLSKYGSEPGKHIGCANLKDTIVKKLSKNLKLVVVGHIHEGYGIEIHDGVTYVNASVLNEHYRQVNRPIVVDLV